MKKLSCCRLLLLFLALPVLTNAQQKKTDRDWKFYVGPNIALPVRYLNLFNGLGIGASAVALRQFASNFEAGGRVNYNYFFGRKADAYYGAARYKATNLLNILAEAKYIFDNGFQAGLNLGVGLSFSGNEKNSDLARLIFIAYQLQQFRNAVIGAYFNQTNYQKQVGVRLDIPL